MPGQLRDLPKIELHVHLEGTVTASIAGRLARKHGQDPEMVLPLEGGIYPRRFIDFADFVRLYQAVSRQIRDPDDLALVATSFASAQQEQGVLYSEVTFTALTHVHNGMHPRDMWQALRDGFAEAPGTRVSLIIDAVRDLGRDHAKETIALVEGADAPIVGLGLTGTEGSVPEDEFLILPRAASDLGLGLTIHAGETGGPEHVRASLDLLGAQRLGHGVRAVEDPDLVERLVRDQVPLEVCPSSNVCLGVAPDHASHPFSDLWRAGANVTLSSDDPPFFATTLSRELALVAEVVPLGSRDLLELQLRAADAAFLPAREREELKDRIRAWPGTEGPDQEGGTGGHGG